MHYFRRIILGTLSIFMLHGMDTPPLDKNHQELIDTIRIDTSISGSNKILLTLLQSHPKLSEKIIELDHKGNCALDYALENDHDELIEILYTNLTQMQKNELLRRAANRGDVYQANQCIQNGAQIIHKANMPPFTLAAQNGHRDVIALFYEKRPVIKNQFNYGLAIASQRAHKELVVWLLEHGAQPGHKDPNSQETPLQLAMGKNPNIGGDITTVGILLDASDL